MNNMNHVENPFSNPAAGEQAAPAGAGFDIFGSGSPGGGMDMLGSLFPGVKSMGKLGEPTAEDIEKEMEKVRYSKIVKVKAVHVKTFDFSNPGHVKAYTQLYVDLYKLAAESKILFTTKEKKFINDTTNPRWVVHLEWLEYDLEVKDFMEEGGADDAKDS